MHRSGAELCAAGRSADRGGAILAFSKYRRHARNRRCKSNIEAGRQLALYLGFANKGTEQVKQAGQAATVAITLGAIWKQVYVNLRSQSDQRNADGNAFLGQ